MKLFKLLSKYCFLTSFILFFLSCNQKKVEEKEVKEAGDFVIENFKALNNYKAPLEKEGTSKFKRIHFDYENAINTGFILPTIRQIKEGYFTIDFDIKNKHSETTELFYKIYYQNDSYKFPELDSSTGKEHRYAEENFYGSWENTDVMFKKISVSGDGEFHKITDSIRIVGNPRNEQKYFKDGRNDRWKHNPRVGTYSFMLVVCDAKTLSEIPEYVKNISLQNAGHFITPYYYFLYDKKGVNQSGRLAIIADEHLKAIAKPDLTAGIYVDMRRFPSVKKKPFYDNACGTDTSLYMNAAFAQFVDGVNERIKFDNIPVVADVVGDNYSKLDYNWNRSFYTKNEMVTVTPEIAHEPCKTVFSDPVNKKIVIKNPAVEYGKWRKERVGIISRHGLTYGKWRVKCKLTELLSKDGVWNGMTNAIWLIHQGDEGGWNNRRICNNGGYMATYWGGYEDKRVPTQGYSEIDFEILKTVPYCPDADFPPLTKNPNYNKNNIGDWNVPLAPELKEGDDKISVACTNWDMACADPVKYGVGCNPVKYNNQTFLAHRWDPRYRALTEKSLQKDDELFGSKYYYFEIDWQPDKIIWRIGPEADQMRIVGYMDNTVTAIPENQMHLIVDQEWHNTKWWPGSPYEQGNIPFPAKDLVGEIYEVVIE